jgi:hypothetical protein
VTFGRSVMRNERRAIDASRAFERCAIEAARHNGAERGAAGLIQGEPPLDGLHTFTFNVRSPNRCHYHADAWPCGSKEGITNA